MGVCLVSGFSFFRIDCWMFRFWVVGFGVGVRVFVFFCVGNPYVFNGSGPAQDPTPPEKSRKMYGKVCIFNDSGPPMLPTPPRNS